MSSVIVFWKDIPQLKSRKKIYICLPDKKPDLCPVLFMHDGHNLFFPEDSFSGKTWRVRETLDEIRERTGRTLAIVGISADENRFDEYSPWKADDFYAYADPGWGNHPGGKGDLYLDWLANDLMPLILEKYGPFGPNMMAGSSMGGFISLYAGYKFRGLFSKIGVFSPALWFNERKMTEFIEANFDPDLGVYLSIGKKEGGSRKRTDFPEIYLDGARNLRDLLKKLGTSDLCYVEDRNGLHSETSWARRFPGFVEWALRT